MGRSILIEIKCTALKGNLLHIGKRKPNLIRQQEISISKSVRKAITNNMVNQPQHAITNKLANLDRFQREL